MPLSEAAATISDLATEIQAETHRTVEVVEEACAGRKSRAAKVETARDAFREIGDSVTAMTSRIQEVAEATAEVAAVAEQSSASAQEIAASAPQRFRVQADGGLFHRLHSPLWKC